MSKNRQTLLIYVFLAILTLAAFRQVTRCDFINYDDPAYVVENMHVRYGVTMEAVRWAITSGYAANWHPLTWMSHMLDIQLFGLNPHLHHLTNLLFHIANTMLLFFVFNRMTKAPCKSAFVAALFAIHPLHVESVVWVAERKDVLSTFFWMLTMAAYIYYVERPSFYRYGAVVIFFALGLMSKPMLVTLPFALLLTDYWPLKRMPEVGGRKSEDGGRISEVGSPADIPPGKPSSGNKKKGTSANKPTAQPPPLFSALKPKRAQSPPLVKGGKGNFSSALSGTQQPERRTQSLVARTTRQISTTRLPSGGPKVLGPQSFAISPQASALSPQSFKKLLFEKLPLFALSAVSCLVTYIVQQRGGAVGSLKLFPIGVRVANALVSYVIYMKKSIWPSDLAVFYPHQGSLPVWLVLSSGLILLAVTVIAIWKAEKVRYIAFGWLWFAGTLVPVIGVVQVGAQAMADRYTYIPSIGLFVAAVWSVPELFCKLWPAARFRKAPIFLATACLLGCLSISTWLQVGHWQDSITLCDHSLKVTGDNDTVLVMRGEAYGKLGNFNRAIQDFDRALQINPGKAEAYFNRGVVDTKLGSQPEAVSDYSKAIEINPEYPEAYYNRGLAYAKLGDRRQAIENFSKALEVAPKYVEALNNRGSLYGLLNLYGPAIEDFSRSIEIDSKRIEPYYNLAITYSRMGDYSKAIENFGKVIQLGYSHQAIEDYNRAIELDPRCVLSYYNRGLAYAELHRDREAAEDMERAAKLGSEEAKSFLTNRGIEPGNQINTP